jgi:glycosyltransferase involved in cell wall biosynthesis
MTTEMKANEKHAGDSSASADGTLLIVSYEELSAHNGLNTRIRGIVRALSAAGRRAEIVAPVYGRQTSAPPADLDGLRVHTVPVPRPFPQWSIPVVTRTISVVFLTIALIRFLRRLPGPFAWVQSEQIYPFPACYLLARKWGAKVILDDPALQWLFVEEKLKRRRIAKWVVGRSVEAFEVALCKRADYILCSAERTTREIGRRIGGAATCICRLSNGVDLDEFPADPDAGPGNRLFFNASLPYYQNVAALRNFLKICAHFESQGFHDYSGLVVVNDAGALSPDVAQTIAANPQLRLLSNQPSLVPWLHASDLVLLPYEKGHLTTAGPRLKVFEALACGKIVLSTREGLDGIPGCVDSRNVILCSDWRDMADQTLALIAEGQTERKQALRREARLLVENEYSWRHLVKAYEPLLGFSLADNKAPKKERCHSCTS